MTAAAWSFYALGAPASQGSKRHVGNGIMVESSKALRPWRDTVTAAGYGAGPCLDGPIVAKVVFTLPRPKSARKADFAPCRGIDVDKALRAVFDAVTAAGLWGDDARVVDMLRLAKVWTGFDDDALPVPGVIVAAAELAAWEAPIASCLEAFHTAKDAAWCAYQHEKEPA